MIKRFFTSNGSLLYIVSFLLLLIFGLIMRLRGLPGHMYFYGDQGQDLMVALRIVRGEFFPLVGPILTVRDFFTPPTYYYFLAFLLQIFKSEVVIIYVFVAMNLIGAVFFALYIKEKSDNLTSLIFLFLYMYFDRSVEMTHSIWQPFPAVFFVAIALWIMNKAKKEHSHFKLFVSIILFTIGFTSYVNAVLLIPLFLHECYLFYKHKLKKIQSITASLVTVGLSTLLFSLTWLKHEMEAGYPSFNALIRPASYTGDANSQFVFFDSIHGVFNRLWVHLFTLYRLLIPNIWPEKGLSFLSYAFLVSLFLFASALLINKSLIKKLKDFLASIGFLYIVSGVLALIFFHSYEWYQHVIVLLPFLLFVIAYMISLAAGSKSIYVKIAGLATLVVLLWANFGFRIPFGNCCQTYNDVYSLYNYLKDDINDRGKSVNQHSFRLATSSSYVNYEVQPLWYLFKKYDNYRVRFNQVGNDTDRRNELNDIYQYTYLICFSDKLQDQKCWDFFSDYFVNSRLLSNTKKGQYTIYLVEHI